MNPRMEARESLGNVVASFFIFVWTSEGGKKHEGIKRKNHQGGKKYEE